MALKCEVALLDGSEVIFEIGKKAKGTELFNDVCKHLDVVEKDYFGLIINSEELQYNWLKLDKKIKKQVVKKDTLKFMFAVKYYPSEPATLKEEITRYTICLQIRRDLATNLTCSLDKLAILLSYWIQSEYEGESNNVETVKDCLKNFKNPPTESSSQEFLEKVLLLYGARAEMSSAAADHQLLLNACRLPMYGVHFYEGKDTTGSEILVGISARGVIEKRKGQTPISHPWARIKNLSYKKPNRFKIKLLRAPSNGDPRLKKTFIFGSEAQVHAIWNTAVNHHVFYRVGEKEKRSISSQDGSTKKPKKRNSLVRRLSSRKKKPKTEGDVQEESSKIKRRPPTVTRTGSLRRSVSLKSSSSSSVSTQHTSGAAELTQPGERKFSTEDRDDSFSNSSDEKSEDSHPCTEAVYTEVQKSDKNQEVVDGREYNDEDILDAVIGTMDGNTNTGSSILLLTETIIEEDEEQQDAVSFPTNRQGSARFNKHTTFIPIQSHLEILNDSCERRPLETDLDADAVLSPIPRNMQGSSPIEFEINFPVKEEVSFQSVKHTVVIQEDTEVKEEYTEEVWEDIEVEPLSPRKKMDVHFKSGLESPDNLQENLENTEEEKINDNSSYSSSKEGTAYFEEEDEVEIQTLLDDKLQLVQNPQLPVFDDRQQGGGNELKEQDYLHSRYSVKSVDDYLTTSIKEYVPKSNIESCENSDDDNEATDILAENDKILAELQQENVNDNTDKGDQHDGTEVSLPGLNIAETYTDIQPDSSTFKVPGLTLYSLDSPVSEFTPDPYPEITISGQQVDDSVADERFPDEYGREDNPSPSSNRNMLNLSDNQKNVDKSTDFSIPSFDETSQSYSSALPVILQHQQDIGTDENEEHEEYPLQFSEINESKRFSDFEDEYTCKKLGISLDSLHTLSETGSISTSDISEQQEKLNFVYSEHLNDDEDSVQTFNRSDNDDSSDLDIKEEEKSSGKEDSSVIIKNTLDLPGPKYDDILSSNYEPALGLGEDLRFGLEPEIVTEGRFTAASTTAATIGDDDDLALDELDEEILYEEEHPVTEKVDVDETRPNDIDDDVIESRDYQLSPGDSTSRSTSLSDITNNTDELLQPDILERTWAEGARLSEDDELFRVLFRTPPMRRRQRRNKSDINPSEVRKGKHEAIAFKSKIDEEPVSPRRRGNLCRRPFIPSWPFAPTALLDKHDLEDLDRAALEAAIDAQRELVDEERRIEDMDLMDDIEFPSPEIFEEEFEPYIQNEIVDNERHEELEPILEYFPTRSRSPSASPRMVGAEFIPGVPDFVQSVVPYQLKTPPKSDESSESSRAVSPETVVDVEIDPESLKFPKPILKFSAPQQEKESLDYQYDPSVEKVQPGVKNKVFENSNIIVSSSPGATKNTQIPPQTESSGRSTPQSTTEHSSQSEGTSSSSKSSSSFPRFIHSVFPLRRSSSEKNRGRSKTRRKPEKKVTKQKHKKKSRSKSKDKERKTPPVLPSIEVTSPTTPGFNEFNVLPLPPHYSTIMPQVESSSLAPPIPKERSTIQEQNVLPDTNLPQYDQESLDKIILSESDDAHSDTGTTTPDTVRRADAYTE